MMRIVLNGEDRSIEASTIATLIAEIGLEARKIAVERNREIVPKSQYDATVLQDGDQIEIVHFVGGG